MINNPNSSSPEHIQPNITSITSIPPEELSRPPMTDTPLTRDNLAGPRIEKMTPIDAPLTRYSGRPYEYEMTSMPGAPEFVREQPSAEPRRELGADYDLHEFITGKQIGSIATGNISDTSVTESGDQTGHTAGNSAETAGDTQVFDDDYWEKTEIPLDGWREEGDGWAEEPNNAGEPRGQGWVDLGDGWIENNAGARLSDDMGETVIEPVEQTAFPPVTLDEPSSATDRGEHNPQEVSPEDSRLAADAKRRELGADYDLHEFITGEQAIGNVDSPDAPENDDQARPTASDSTETLNDEPRTDTGDNIPPRDSDGPTTPPDGSDEFNGPDAGDGWIGRAVNTETTGKPVEDTKNAETIGEDDDPDKKKVDPKIEDPKPAPIPPDQTPPDRVVSSDTGGSNTPSIQELAQQKHTTTGTVDEPGRYREAIRRLDDPSPTAAEQLEALKQFYSKGFSPEVKENVARMALDQVRRIADEVGTNAPLGDNASPPEAIANPGVPSTELSDRNLGTSTSFSFDTILHNEDTSHQASPAGITYGRGTNQEPGDQNLGTSTSYDTVSYDGDTSRRSSADHNEAAAPVNTGRSTDQRSTTSASPATEGSLSGGWVVTPGEILSLPNDQVVIVGTDGAPRGTYDLTDGKKHDDEGGMAPDDAGTAE